MRNPALKTALLDRIQPLVDKLATDLAAPNANERWSSERIDRERDEAEARKLEGTLPPAVASFERERPGGMFVELEPEHELDFGAAG